MILQIKMKGDRLYDISGVGGVMVVGKSILLTHFHFHQPLHNGFGGVSIYIGAAGRKIIIIVIPVGFTAYAHVQQLQRQNP